MNSKVSPCTHSLALSFYVALHYHNILILVHLLIGFGFWQVDAPDRYSWMHLHQTWLDGLGGQDDASWLL